MEQGEPLEQVEQAILEPREELFKQVEKITADHPVGLEGWCTKDKANAMVELILEHRPAVSVEIGVFGGKSLVPQALACKYLEHGHVYGIDPWTAANSLQGVQEKANIDWWKDLDYERHYRWCLTAVLDYGVSKYCTIVRTTSDRACAMFDYIDVLHLDGNHSEEVSTIDVFLYLPKVRAGGFVWFDDFDGFATKNAVRLVEERCEQVQDIERCRLYRKSR